MSVLTTEAKESIILKALNRGSEPLKSIALANNIGLSTLGRWLRQHRKGLSLSGDNRSVNTSELTRKEQFHHVLSTHHLEGVSLGKYCRKHGLYSHQLTQWQDTFMKTPERDNSQQQQSLKKLKEENKRLQKELRGKEKALAEASALLIMKKKADLIWGADEDD